MNRLNLILRRDQRRFTIGTLKQSSFSSLAPFEFDIKCLTVSEHGVSIVVASTAQSFISKFSCVSTGWVCYELITKTEFETPGVIARLVDPLAINGIGCCVNSTFDGDLIFISEKDLASAEALWSAEQIEVYTRNDQE